MKTLNFGSCGATELNQDELMNYEGGSLIGLGLGLLFIALVATSCSHTTVQVEVNCDCGSKDNGQGASQDSTSSK